MAEKKEKRYVSDNAQLMVEWNWERNIALGFDPQKITCGSGLKCWWKCNKGHEWQAVIGDRNNGTACPFCAGKKVLKGYNDLHTINPSIAKEWNYEKNGNLKPEDFTTNSGRKVWWKCSLGHEWQTTIDHRNRGSGCPYCSNKKVLSNYNDLQTINPTLAKEWNYEKNGESTPEKFTANSTKKVWWKCNNGHEWQATINNRNSGKNCPYCAGLYTIKGINDLKTVNPMLAKEWNYEKNNGLTPFDITPNSNKNVWWRCNKGHEWQAIIANRTKGRGCPICHSERHTSFPEYAIVYYFAKHGWEVIHSYKNQGYELDIYIPSKKIAIEYDGFFGIKTEKKKTFKKTKNAKRMEFSYIG